MRAKYLASLVLAVLAVPSAAIRQATDAIQSSIKGRLNSGGVPPFSFTYGGRPSTELVPKWRARREAKRLDEGRTRITLTQTDPVSGLEVRCVALAYDDFPAVEWTVYLRNRGKQDSPIVENLQALDTTFERTGDSEFLLHHNVGSPASASDYGPLETPLGPETSRAITAAGGRATNSDMSYFNLAWGNRGTIVVVGWPGQWAADFIRDKGRGIRVKAGQELTHFKLRPGEEVRTPLIVLLDWKGDWIDGQNAWRRWMTAYGMPRPGGKPPEPMTLACTSHIYGEMIGANEANQIMNIDRYVEEGLKPDFWWMDAGWYVQKQGWPQVGTWEVDTSRFPHGLKPITDHAHGLGMKTLVWFEPERVAPGTWLADNHPEWLLNPASSLQILKSQKLGGGEPCVVFNTGTDRLSFNGITFEPKRLSFHPGPKGEYSVVRWTAPSSGEYQISCAFAGIDEKTTTDVHVLHGGKSLFDGLINLNGQGKRTDFKTPVHLQKGETVDFIVGFGNGSYTYDSTGIDALVTGPGGDRHDAAMGFGRKGNWTYGYLNPAAAPDPSTFQPYDATAQGGANGTALLNLGNPRAWKWLVEHVDNLLIDNGIDLYRQDFNMDPLTFWRSNDPLDRQGITEIKHVVGYLAYWDELRRRHPNMLIDSCASGGRRNDLETMRRSVPLWRSDYAFEPTGHQGMTYGISMWLPYHGTGTLATAGAPYYGSGLTPVEPYTFWSNVAPSLVAGFDMREKGLDYATLRRLYAGWKDICHNYSGDYYPLTPYSLADHVWIAWQFNKPDAGEGMVQAFRRKTAAEETLHLKLRGLDPAASYVIKVVDGPGCESLDGKRWTGAELMSAGLPVRLKEAPSAAVLSYGRVDGS